MQNSTRLRKINKEAQAIRKRHPGKSWGTAMKEAGRKISGMPGKKKPARKKKTGRVSGKKTGSATAVKKLRKAHEKEGLLLSQIGSVSGHLNAARHKLKEEIGWMEATKLTTKKAESKKKLQKRINAKKAQFRNLSK